MKFGCQTFSWQMSYEKYAGALPAICSVIRTSGFRGVEAETCMLGTYYDDPPRLRSLLAESGLELAALTLVLPWRQWGETAEEKAEADRLLNVLKHFPEAMLVLVQMPGKNRSDLRHRQMCLLECVNAIGRRAAAYGIVTAFHPNSSPGSIFRTREDYDVLFDGLDARYVGYAPDTGHIANGNMDVAEVIRQAQPLIRHVHFKDIGADGQWRKMGEGIIDHRAIVRLLKKSGYDGWIMVEEESAEAVADPDGVTRHNGNYVQKELIPLLSEEGV